MYQNFIGIDISKKDFSVGIHGKNKTTVYLSSPEGFDEFYSDHKTLLENSLVVLETTGGYELSLIHYLQACDKPPLYDIKLSCRTMAVNLLNMKKLQKR